MEGTRFDHLNQAFATHKPSRRGVLGRMLPAAGAASEGACAADEVWVHTIRNTSSFRCFPIATS